MADDPEPLLDADEIQANILPGFGRQQQYFVGFSCQDGAALRRALAALHPFVTTLTAALAHRDDRKAAILAGSPRPQRGDLWLNLALGPRATDALGAPMVRTLDTSFRIGMKPPLTGDPTAPDLPDGTPNPAHPSRWVVGSPGQPLDLLLIFAHDQDIEAEAAPVVTQVAGLLGAEPAYREVGALLPGEIEHFGFRDGISQVGVRGRIRQDGEERFVTTRYGVPSRDGLDFGKPGQPLVWPGRFLTGQPTFAGDSDVLEPEYSNGSFLVFRRLRQDVAAFDRDTQAMAAAISEGLRRTVTADELRARIVGRYPSGAALMRHDQAPPGAEGPNEINYFGFSAALPPIVLDDGSTASGSPGDPGVTRGQRCPIWAHIRKVNPRELPTNQGDAARTLSFQMLRRGIPFGPAYLRTRDAPSNNDERGLLFVSYQRTIDGQFGKLNRDWMNNRDAPSAGGFDLLVGQNVDTASHRHAAKPALFVDPLSGPDEKGFDFAAPTQWVIPTGGAFLFAPSMAFLRTFSPPLVA